MHILRLGCGVGCGGSLHYRDLRVFILVHEQHSGNCFPLPLQYLAPLYLPLELSLQLIG